MPRRQESLSDRVKYLIDRWHNGAVNAAAGDIGVPEPTLRRIVAGDTVNPRLAVLQKIAKHYRIGLDWLVSGTGEEPADVERLPTRWLPVRREWLVWSKLVEDLGLTGAEADAVLHLPTATALGWNRLAVEAQKDHGAKALTVLADAHGTELDAWTKLVSGLVDTYGKKEVVRALRRHIDKVRLGFAALPLWALQQDRLAANLGEQFPRAVDGLLSPDVRRQHGADDA